MPPKNRNIGRKNRKANQVSIKRQFMDESLSPQPMETEHIESAEETINNGNF